MTGRGAVVGALVCMVLGLAAACSAVDGGAGSSIATAGSSGAHPSTAGSSPTRSAVPSGWVDDEITFRADGVTVHGTFRHPSTGPAGSTGSAGPTVPTAATGSAGSTALPAALLIAGSGPTDRNGNSRLVPGSMNTLANLADALSADGVASLRYDKLGSGATGLGKYAANPDSIGLDVFSHEAQAALRFLASQPGVDRARLSAYGHSEGALFALLLATDSSGSAPSMHSLGLLEPLSKRYLDVITEQVVAQADQQRKSGQITEEQSDEVRHLVKRAVKQLRTKGTVPADMPYGLSTLFTPSSLKFLREADAIDPATLGAKLPAAMPVLVTCSDADIQVSCGDVEHLADAITSTGLDLVHLTGVNHVLKEDPSRTPANYGKDLPFSSQLTAALGTFVTK